MEDRGILDRLSGAGSPEEAVGLFHYHGTVEDFSDAPRGGGFDGVFWCAGSPAVAQCYIPASGGESILVASGHELRERVRPSRSSAWYDLVVAMGYGSPDVEWGPDGRARSWAVPDGSPTYGEVADWLEAGLGYGNESRNPGMERFYRVKTSFSSGTPVYLPASHLEPGRLFVVDGIPGLRLLDMAAGGEGDLMDPDHLKLEAFAAARDRGYDGIVINDHCQSRTWGNVGHRSWGVLPAAMGKISWAEIPAVRFDWPEGASGCSRAVTPEFEAEWLSRRASPRP